MDCSVCATALDFRYSKYVGDLAMTKQEVIDRYKEDPAHENEVRPIKCKCGCEQFYVDCAQFPHTGAFIGIRCVNCNETEVLINDYA